MMFENGKETGMGLQKVYDLEMEIEDLKRKEHGLHININWIEINSINQFYLLVLQSLETAWAILNSCKVCDPVLHKVIELARRFFAFFSKIWHHQFPWSSKASHRDKSNPKDALRDLNFEQSRDAQVAYAAVISLQNPWQASIDQKETKKTREHECRSQAR